MNKGEREFWEAQLRTEKRLLLILVEKWACGNHGVKEDIVKTKKHVNHIQKRLNGLGE
tara:strand:- start:203 stop:376 length:174 start_codon:yes stop_codon:yes gene_type:complete